MSVFEIVRRLVSEAYDEPLENITAETRLADLDDSLSSVELIMSLEDEFHLDIEIPDGEEWHTFFAGIETVGQLAEWVEQSLSD
jgi:acyl carrier protein